MQALYERQLHTKKGDASLHSFGGFTSRVFSSIFIPKEARKLRAGVENAANADTLGITKCGCSTRNYTNECEAKSGNPRHVITFS